MQVTDVDVTKGGLAVSCDTNKTMKIWTTNNGEVRVSEASSLANCELQKQN